MLMRSVIFILYVCMSMSLGQTTIPSFSLLLWLFFAMCFHQYSFSATLHIFRETHRQAVKTTKDNKNDRNKVRNIIKASLVYQLNRIISCDLVFHLALILFQPITSNFYFKIRM